jgi:hypothetical protein
MAEIEEVPGDGTHAFVVWAADENGITEYNPGVAEALGRAEDRNS